VLAEQCVLIECLSIPSWNPSVSGPLELLPTGFWAAPACAAHTLPLLKAGWPRVEGGL